MMRNPVFESSMKRRMRSFRAPLLLTLYIVFLLVVSFTAILTLQRDSVTLGNLRAGLETYIYLSVMQFALILLVAPALTTGAISGERERQTLDLLLCTRVGAWRIVVGKLFSSLCFLALMVISSLPVMAVTMYFGGVSIWDMLVMELFLIVTALACCAIGIFCSAAFKRTVTATVVAYLTIFAVGIGTLIIPLIFQTKQLEQLIQMGYTYTSSTSAMYASSMAVIGGSSGPTQIVTSSSLAAATPLMFYLNPAIGLFSMLITQTGVLQRTFEQFMGYMGSELFNILGMLKSFAWINMAVLTVVSAILTFLSTLFVKPTGLRAKKQKK